MSQLEGRRVAVTGAAGGIGAPVARLLREAGVEEVFTISGATGEGVPALLDAVLPLLGDIGIARQAFEDFDDEEEPEAEDKPWSPL